MDISYKAFISYSHKDAGWARWLLTALETYRVPDSTTRGVGRVFRDRDEASAAADLKEEIQRALSASEHLIVIASPHSARSTYVQAEIEFFSTVNAARSSPGRILTLIVAGEPNVTAGDIADPRECFPPALRGGLHKPDGTSFEPLAADARPIGDGRTRALAKLVAGLMDIRYDSLVRRDLRRRRRSRMLVAAATVAAFAVTGGMGAAIYSGTLEQERLRVQGELEQQRFREASEAAARDARTVTAASNAERASRIFQSGNLADAVALATASLPNDGSLPFIPQAYSVLYEALFQAGAPRGLDLRYDSFSQTSPFLLENGEFVSVNEANTVVWTPLGGATFVRVDTNNRTSPTMTPTGSALFFKLDVGLLRYRAATGVWEKLDDDNAAVTSRAEKNIGIPGKYVALNDSTVAGCSGTMFIVINIPAEGEGPGRAGPVKDMGSDCEVLSLSDLGNVVIELESGDIAEVDPKSGEPVGLRYKLRDFFVLWANMSAKTVVVGTISKTYVFNRADGTQILSFGDSTEPYMVGPDGMTVFERGVLSGSEGPVLHHIGANSATRLACQLCSFVGYLDDGKVLMLDGHGREVQRFDPKTGQPIGTLLTFSTTVEHAELLADGATVLGLRTVGDAVAVSLKRRSRDNIVVSGPQPFLVSAGFAGPSTIVVQQDAGTSSIPMQTVLRMYEANTEGKEVVAPDLTELGGVSDVLPLANGLFSVFGGDSIFWSQGPVRIFEAATGKKVFATTTTFAPHLFADGRYLLLSDEQDFNVFDTVSRLSTPLLAGTGAAMMHVWSVKKDRLAVVNEADARVYTLGTNGAALASELKLPGMPTAACITQSGQSLYVLDFSQPNAFLARIAVNSGEVLARHEFDIDQDDGSDLVTVLSDATITDGYSSILTCDDSRAVVRDELSGLAAIWSPASNQVTTTRLPDADPVPVDTAGTIRSPVDPEVLNRVEFGHSETQAWLRDGSQGPVVTSISAEGVRISAATWLPATKLIALGLANGRLQVWDPTHPSAPQIDLVAHGEAIEGIDVSPDGKTLLTSVSGGTVKLWPLLSVEELRAEAATLVE